MLRPRLTFVEGNLLDRELLHSLRRLVPGQPAVVEAGQAERWSVVSAQALLVLRTGTRDADRLSLSAATAEASTSRRPTSSAGWTSADVNVQARTLLSVLNANTAGSTSLLG